ncbi:Protein kinase domain [Dillenia turbinata]|uniref:non-specific serine/threonine protein kinase n=1 Tax=Dillenia turbinata TaxID=194707 RepID=A0AAN8V8I4_9MAGN
MTTVSFTIIILSISVTSLFSPANSLGSGSTIAVISDTKTVCGIVAGEQNQLIQCYSQGQTISVLPNVSFESISGGDSVFCGLRSGGYSLQCWNTSNSSSSFPQRRVYYNDTFLLSNVSVGDSQICALSRDTGFVKCWRVKDDYMGNSSIGILQFESISSGLGFTCGLLANTSRVRCWGSNSIASSIESQFEDFQMLSIVAGGSHVCGINTTGFVICKGSNSSGQLASPKVPPFEFGSFALGVNHSCAIRESNGSVVCWGGSGSEFSSNVTDGISFEVIVAGLDFTCGLITANLSVICWGPGWNNGEGSNLVPLPAILPGPCVQSSSCKCGIYTNSQVLCSSSSYFICKPCNYIEILSPPAPPPSPSASHDDSGDKLSKGLLAFGIVGSIGIVAGICTIVYCVWTGVCCGNKRIHNTVQPTISAINGNTTAPTSNSSPPSRSSTIRRQGSRIMRRQRSGTSSKHADRAEEFFFKELAAATNNFSLENKIGAGSFGIVYKGKLLDGREVAIKRGETQLKTRKFQEKESAFDSELAFLSRLHHKHLVRLVGFCQEMDERLLVYEYMKNGALYDHLHDKNNVEKCSSFINSWKMRIKISLDAARGIEYLHSYAVPPIIHRDIKSSNILLDANWTARVSDFGLSLMGPESDQDFRPTKAAGTVGYIDPEYYGLNVLTAKSDVYGLGVVMLELLTGKRAIFKNGDGGSPISVVDYAVPAIMEGELNRILDARVGLPEMGEADAVELMAYTALHCVNLEGRERPSMTDIVSSLERALSLCDNSHGSISSATISIVSE